MKRTRLLLFCIFSIGLVTLHAQSAEPKPVFTHTDTLRGTVTPERAWWDVMKYEIHVQPDYNTKTIQASNTIRFKILKGGAQKMQIDLQPPLQIDSILFINHPIEFNKADINVWYVYFSHLIPTASNSADPLSMASITVFYHGKPREAVRPPWDGGWIWTKDKLGRPWMSVACQGLGASVWYPCKDYQGDEPDQGASLSITIPDTLVAIGNGRLAEKKSEHPGLTTYTWVVKNPINNYDIIPYIGKYAGWHETYPGEKGNLDCDFWVLDYELEKAKSQFKQVDSMLHCFEYWMGPYPFYEDGYKLVQAPHLGMEHQSAVAYGNHFGNGYLGRDLSHTGWGLKWDFIIVHESGHEWFGNNITTKDLADMWVHEGFANYTETLYTTCQDGVQAGNEYCMGTRENIRNDKPIIGYYQVNNQGSGDMYYKGGNMIHTIRQLIHDDEKFRQILRGLNHHFYHQTVTTQQIENYISEQAHMDLSKVFDEYLRTTQVPVLEFKTSEGTLQYRWTHCVPGFQMPIKVNTGKEQWIHPTGAWKTLGKENGYDGKTFLPDPNFYILLKKAE